uniref:Succinylglutamate desuccinylase n=1 Tax=Lygus hesperus TaxID=30085 RepID=A0A0A9ZEZ4_LYGHE
MSSETGGKSVPEDGGDGHDSKMDSSSTRLDISAELNRIQLSDHQVDGLPVEELRALLRKQDSYISALETRNRTFEDRIHLRRTYGGQLSYPLLPLPEVPNKICCLFL